MNPHKFPISEIFGPTLQGEGPYIGEKCVFIRFALCPHDCAFCDSKYTWDPDHPEYGYEQLTVGEIINRVAALRTRVFPSSVVLTGGEPALQKTAHMIDFLTELWRSGVARIQVETSGTIFQEWMASCNSVVISPKMSNAQLSDPETTTPDRVLNTVRLLHDYNYASEGPMHRTTTLKPVVFTRDDVVEAKFSYFTANFMARVGAFVFQVGTKPGDGVQDLLNRWRLITEVVLEDEELSACRVLPQSHVLLWGHKRGV